MAEKAFKGHGEVFEMLRLTAKMLKTEGEAFKGQHREQFD